MCEPNNCLWPNCDCDSPPIEKRGVNYVEELLRRKQDKTAEAISHELAIIRNIWRRAYLDTEEGHVKILKDYGDRISNPRTSELEAKIKSQRQQGIQEAIDELRKVWLYHDDLSLMILCLEKLKNKDETPS